MCDTDAAAATEPRIQRASALLKWHSLRLRTGCDAIDELLGGGIPARGITEIAGEASAGKTQLALQLVFQAQAPAEQGGLQGGALFLHTEGGAPPMKRLRQISEAYAAKWASMGASVEALCEQVYVESVETADLLLGTLRYRVPALLASRRVRLVLVDSVGALFRTHLDDDLPRRSELLIQLAAEMKRLSEQMHVAFVVLNQVSDAFDGPSGGALPLPPSLAKRAALGLTWSHCVNTRILLSRGRAQCAGLGPERRTLRLLLSPSAEQGSCEYVIDASGVRDAPALAAPPHEAGGRPWGTSPAAVVAGDSHSRGF